MASFESRGAGGDSFLERRMLLTDPKSCDGIQFIEIALGSAKKGRRSKNVRDKGAVKAVRGNFCAAVKPRLFVSAPKGVEAVEFYVNAFGAKVIRRSIHSKTKEDEECLLSSAELKMGSSKFIVSESNDDALIGGGRGCILRVEADDVAGAVAKAVGAGAQRSRKVVWGEDGTELGSVMDPYGFVWHLGSPTVRLLFVRILESEDEGWRRMDASITIARDVFRDFEKLVEEISPVLSRLGCHEYFHGSLIAQLLEFGEERGYMSRKVECTGICLYVRNDAEEESYPNTASFRASKKHVNVRVSRERFHNRDELFEQISAALSELGGVPEGSHGAIVDRVQVLSGEEILRCSHRVRFMDVSLRVSNYRCKVDTGFMGRMQRKKNKNKLSIWGLKPTVLVRSGEGEDAVEFYKTVFGAEEIWRTNSKPLSVRLAMGHFNIFIVCERRDDDDDDGCGGGRGFVFSVDLRVVDPDVALAVVSKAVAAGAVTSESYAGSPPFGLLLTDPYGILWKFSALH